MTSPLCVSISRLLATAVLLASSLAHAQTTWVDRTANLTGGNNINTGIAYNGSRFLMVTSSPSTYWSSAAGTANWSFSSFSFPASVNGLTITHGNGATLVAASNNVLMRTTASNPVGTDWTSQRPLTRPNASNPTLYRARFINSQFVVGTAFYADTDPLSYSEVITSSDGLTWTPRKFTYSSLGNNLYNLRDVAFKPGASAGTGTYIFATGTNTVLVASETLSAATRVNFSANGSDTAFTVTYGGGLFVIVTSNAKIFTSATGGTGTWTQRTIPVAPSLFNDVFHDGTTFVAVGDTVSGSSPARPAILNSTDGIIWTEATTVPATNQPLRCVFKGDGLWLTGGNTRTLFTSGSSSVSAPSFSSQPTPFFGSTGGTITLSATATGTPAATVRWYRGTTALTDDTRISGALSGTLTITGATFADAGTYFMRATNTVGSTDSSSALVSLNATAGGAVFSPYGQSNTLGGSLIFGTSPPQAAIGGIPARFTAGAGVTSLPNTTLSGTSYTLLGGVSSDGTRLLLNPASGNKPPVVYSLATSTATPLANVTLPLGTITSIDSISGGGLSNGGDVTGSINDQGGNLHAFHYSATTQTYTLLGLVPNATNDRATSTGGISSDGTTISGYERISFFNGPFVWTTTGGFTLLPQPANGSVVNGDIREISPNGRFIVGQGLVSPAFGSGTTAMRWDRGSPAGAPVGFALPGNPDSTYADPRTVNNDGAAAGSAGTSFLNARAAIWLPTGALIKLPDYLATTYGLTTPGYVLNQVTSISSDLRTIVGTATNSASLSEGWILTLPAPLSAPTVPNIAIRRFSDFTSGDTTSFGSYQIGAPLYLQQTLYVRNDGTAPLTGLSATITGPDAADFTYVLDSGLTDPLPDPLGLNEFVTVSARFVPLSGTAGPRTATLTVTSDDPDTPSFVVNLSGTATAPSAFVGYLIAANVPANQRAATDDPDSDGVANLLEFALGLGPLTPDSGSLPVAAVSGDNLTLTYVRAEPAAVTYAVESTSDLTTNSWTVTGVTQGSPDVDGVTTASIPITSGAHFVRLRVTLNP